MPDRNLWLVSRAKLRNKDTEQEAFCISESGFQYFFGHCRESLKDL
jgi:hypothetical protein